MVVLLIHACVCCFIITIMMTPMKNQNVSKLSFKTNTTKKNLKIIIILHMMVRLRRSSRIAALNTKPRPTKKIKRDNGTAKTKKKMPSRDKEKRLYEKGFSYVVGMRNDRSYSFTRINRIKHIQVWMKLDEDLWQGQS